MKNKITLLVAALCCVCYAIGCPYVGPYQAFSITDRSTNTPLSGVKVSVYYENNLERYQTTDSTGSFRLRMYGGVSMRIVIKYDGYIGLNQKFNISEDNNMHFDVRLSEVKNPKVRIHEYERFVRTPAYRGNTDDQIMMSQNADPAFTSFACKLKHEHRKAALYIEDKVFNEMLVYPNPVSSGTTMFVESKFDEKKVLALFDMSGVELVRREIIYHQTIETAQLKPGIYIVKIIDARNDDVKTQKLIVY